MGIFKWLELKNIKEKIAFSIVDWQIVTTSTVLVIFEITQIIIITCYHTQRWGIRLNAEIVRI